MLSPLVPITVVAFVVVVVAGAVICCLLLLVVVATAVVDVLLSVSFFQAAWRGDHLLVCGG